MSSLCRSEKRSVTVTVIVFVLFRCKMVSFDLCLSHQQRFEKVKNVSTDAAKKKRDCALGNNTVTCPSDMFEGESV